MTPTRVLFLCIGNSCRSQMAEGFARTYGSDVMVAQSAGLQPATTVAALTRKMMGEKNIDMGTAFPKGLNMITPNGADLIINISGHKLPFKPPVPVEDWEVRDPIGQSEEVYRTVRDILEQRVMRLILALRSKPVAPGPVDTRRRPPRQ